MRRPTLVLVFVARVALAASVASSMLTGCVDTSPDRVRLSASVKNVALSVSAGSLVTTLAGTFNVELDVGDLASGDATIKDPPSFQLVVAKSQKTLRVLDAVPSGDGFPLTVKSGEHRTLSFTVGDTNTLEASAITAACAEPVQVAASLTDTLTADRPTAFESDAVTLSGCP